MSLKDKIMNAVLARPKLAILGISLAITFSISAVYGVTDLQQAHAILAPPCNY